MVEGTPRGWLSKEKPPRITEGPVPKGVHMSSVQPTKEVDSDDS